MRPKAESSIECGSGFLLHRPFPVLPPLPCTSLPLCVRQKMFLSLCVCGRVGASQRALQSSAQPATATEGEGGREKREKASPHPRRQARGKAQRAHPVLTYSPAVRSDVCVRGMSPRAVCVSARGGGEGRGGTVRARNFCDRYCLNSASLSHALPVDK